ncbi:MAG: glycosyltransferase family 2 protein [Magnetococcales bacterium]|nr:glycosyltransferase family 2 protein [Magnetococcales bacterium]
MPLDRASHQVESSSPRSCTVAVIIPCYRVRDRVAEVIRGIGPNVDRIYCVDDACPEQSGRHIQASIADPRVRVLFNEQNLGVGGATLRGFRAALEDRCDILVKLDGDGQMNPGMIPRLISPLLHRRADYSKGNRFYHIEDTTQMPLARLVGNAMLSFVAKASTGYWNIFDPNNGFVAIHAWAARKLPLEKIRHNFFFESDMLFHLNIIGAVVEEVPHKAIYRGEKSNLNIFGVMPLFLSGHVRNFSRRIFYNYFLRGFSVTSLELILGVLLLLWGVIYGAVEWRESIVSGIPKSAGVIILAALPVLIGVQFILDFLGYDMNQIPKVPLQVRFDKMDLEEEEKDAVCKP